eukprot:1123809-Lingulodinium_polyedra.AAC.1
MNLGQAAGGIALGARSFCAAEPEGGPLCQAGPVPPVAAALPATPRAHSAGACGPACGVAGESDGPG